MSCEPPGWTRLNDEASVQPRCSPLSLAHCPWRISPSHSDQPKSFCSGDPQSLPWASWGQQFHRSSWWQWRPCFPSKLKCLRAPAQPFWRLAARGNHHSSPWLQGWQEVIPWHKPGITTKHLRTEILQKKYWININSFFQIPAAGKRFRNGTLSIWE